MNIRRHLVSTLLFILLVNIGLGQTKAMTFNLRYDNPRDGENAWSERRDEVVDLIEHYEPSILGIQEGLFDQMQFLDAHLEKYTYVGVGREDGKTKGEYAGIFYRQDLWTLDHSRTYWLSETPDEISIGWDASMERIATFAAFIEQRTGDTLYVINAHFDHIGIEAQLKSAELLIQIIYEQKLTKSKVLVMGDFNSLPDSEGIKMLEDQMKDSRLSEKTYGPDGTFNAFQACEPITKCIDYIFTQNVHVKHQIHIDDRRKNGLCVSDHLPVLIEFVFP